VGMPVAVFMVFIHNTVPPHPGIVGSTTLLDEDLMGLVTIAGILLAIPMGILVHFLANRLPPAVSTLAPEVERRTALAGAAPLGRLRLAVPVGILVHFLGKRLTSGVFTLAPEVEKKYALAGAASLASGSGAAASETAGAASRVTGDASDTAGSASGPSGAAVEVDAAPGRAERPGRRPPAALVVTLILLPILMIAVGTVGAILLPEGSMAANVISFIGAPAFALLVATLASMYLMGVMYGWGTQQIGEVMDAAIGPAAIVILVTGAGGVF